MASKARTMYVICGIDGTYLYQVIETKYGVFMPDNHGGAKVHRKAGKGNDITAEYGRDLKKAKLFSEQKLAANFLNKYPVLRFCSICKVSAAKMKEILQQEDQSPA